MGIAIIRNHGIEEKELEKFTIGKNLANRRTTIVPKESSRHLEHNLKTSCTPFALTKSPSVKCMRELYLEQTVSCDDIFNIIEQKHLPILKRLEGLDRKTKCQLQSKHLTDSVTNHII